jgi:hypothetical protein
MGTRGIRHPRSLHFLRLDLDLKSRVWWKCDFCDSFRMCFSCAWQYSGFACSSRASKLSLKRECLATFSIQGKSLPGSTNDLQHLCPSPTPASSSWRAYYKVIREFGYVWSFYRGVLRLASPTASTSWLDWFWRWNDTIIDADIFSPLSSPEQFQFPDSQSLPLSINPALNRSVLGGALALDCNMFKSVCSKHRVECSDLESSSSKLSAKSFLFNLT